MQQLFLMHIPEIILYHTLCESAAWADQTNRQILIPGLQCTNRHSESLRKVGLSPRTGLLHSLCPPSKSQSNQEFKISFLCGLQKDCSVQPALTRGQLNFQNFSHPKIKKDVNWLCPEEDNKAAEMLGYVLWGVAEHSGFSLKKGGLRGKPTSIYSFLRRGTGGRCWALFPGIQ